jgi:hypothetical protein
MAEGTRGDDVLASCLIKRGPLRSFSAQFGQKLPALTAAYSRGQTDQDGWNSGPTTFSDGCWQGAAQAATNRSLIGRSSLRMLIALLFCPFWAETT